MKTIKLLDFVDSIWFKIFTIIISFIASYLYGIMHQWNGMSICLFLCCYFGYKLHLDIKKLKQQKKIKKDIIWLENGTCYELYPFEPYTIEYNNGEKYYGRYLNYIGDFIYFDNGMYIRSNINKIIHHE